MAAVLQSQAVLLQAEVHPRLERSSGEGSKPTWAARSNSEAVPSFPCHLCLWEWGTKDAIPYESTKTGEVCPLPGWWAALKIDSDHKLPDPDDLPRFPQEMAGSLQFCSLGSAHPTNLLKNSPQVPKKLKGGGYKVLEVFWKAIC